MTENRIQKVAFSLYPIKDSDRARKFYEETLGFKRGSHSPDGMWTEYDLPGGGCIALYRSEELQPSATAGGSVAVEVDDLDALVAELKAKDVQFQAEMIHSPVCRMSIALDSEGNAIILHQLKPKTTESAA
jgi:predicted enzyme related to lactoylglutathione lyase